MHADRKIRTLMGERRSVFNQVTELTTRIKQQATGPAESWAASLRLNSQQRGALLPRTQRRGHNFTGSRSQPPTSGGYLQFEGIDMRDTTKALTEHYLDQLDRPDECWNQCTTTDPVGDRAVS